MSDTQFSLIEQKLQDLHRQASKLDSNVTSPMSQLDEGAVYRRHDVTIPEHVVVSPQVLHLNLSQEGMQVLQHMSQEEQETFFEF